MILDQSGNLYGTTSWGGSGGGGTVFGLTPGSGGWTFDTLYSFSGGDGGGPVSKLIMDAAGDLYGTSYLDGAYGHGAVFKLTRSNGGWTYTSLHDFNVSDGGGPMSDLVFDAKGNLYGTAAYYGPGSNGVVFEITP